VIRDAVIHLSGEQPLKADLFDTPAARDQGLLCTNLRTLDGKRPVFIDRSESAFYFPYLHIRFVEFTAPTSGLPELDAGPGTETATEAEDEADADLELDEDFLRRIREV
jgi:hypothetical protein